MVYLQSYGVSELRNFNNVIEYIQTKTDTILRKACQNSDSYIESWGRDMAHDSFGSGSRVDSFPSSDIPWSEGKCFKYQESWKTSRPPWVYPPAMDHYTQGANG